MLCAWRGASYVECTSACITALAAFAKEYPYYREDDVRECIRRARAYIVSTQREDGSWYSPHCPAPPCLPSIL